MPMTLTPIDDDDDISYIEELLYNDFFLGGNNIFEKLYSSRLSPEQKLTELSTLLEYYTFSTKSPYNDSISAQLVNIDLNYAHMNIIQFIFEVWSSAWDDNKEITIRVPIMRDKALSYAECELTLG